MIAVAKSDIGEHDLSGNVVCDCAAVATSAMAMVPIAFFMSFPIDSSFFRSDSSNLADRHAVSLASGFRAGAVQIRRNIVTGSRKDINDVQFAHDVQFAVQQDQSDKCEVAAQALAIIGRL